METYVEEFFLSEAVRNEEKGELQFTFGVDARQNLGTNATLQMEYGLTERLQLSFELPYGVTAGRNAEIEAGWSTASLGFQYQFIRSDSPFALSVGMMFGVPAKPGVPVEYEPMALVAKSFHKLQVHGSVVLEADTGGRSLQYNVASVYPTRRQWFPTLEFNGRRLDGRNAWYITPGIYRHLPHRLEMGIGIPSGLGGVAGSVGIVGKINWELGGERDRD